jgi:hypothetical protein
MFSPLAQITTEGRTRTCLSKAAMRVRRSSCADFNPDYAGHIPHRLFQNMNVNNK